MNSDLFDSVVFDDLKLEQSRVQIYNIRNKTQRDVLLVWVMKRSHCYLKLPEVNYLKLIICL